MQPPPANIRSPELRYLEQSCLPMRARSIGADGSSGQDTLRRRRRPQKTIISDDGGFAGAQLSAIHSSPANIRSPELSYRAQSCLPMRARSIGADGSSGQPPSRRRKRSKKIITSDHRGFAGVQPPAMQPPPASIPSPELNSWRSAVLRAAAA